MLMDEDRKKSCIEKVLCTGLKIERKLSRDSYEISEQIASTLHGAGFSDMGPPSHCNQQVETLRIFVATWNVGGKSPHEGMALDDLLCTNEPSDIYVLGFQEIVPLNAGNVLVIEDNEPAAKWLALINYSLNNPPIVAHRGSKHANALGNSPFFVKPSLKRISKTFRTESGRRLKACNCKYELERKPSRDFCFIPCQPSNINEDDLSSEDDDDGFSSFDPTDVSNISSNNQMKYSMISGKQMVGIFLTVWARTELIHCVGHLRTSCIGRGVMGYLGNKGCISVSMSLHQTSFCFICSHLASGEKEGDEHRRNLDVTEILRHTQFRKICRTTNSRMPVKILEHDRIIWLGDLNYRIALSYVETRKLMQEDNWDALLDKDQLKIAREAGRVFEGWKEGKIKFPPTYKYSYNSDVYAGENIKSKRKRRTPAWCDRILWHGNGMQQLKYVRGESRFSDHRPVYADFLVEVMVSDAVKESTPRH